jgi:hypothetical protein
VVVSTDHIITTDIPNNWHYSCIRVPRVLASMNPWAYCVSSNCLPYVVLLSLDGINACLPHVALLTLLLIVLTLNRLVSTCGGGIAAPHGADMR